MRKWILTGVLAVLTVLFLMPSDMLSKKRTVETFKRVYTYSTGSDTSAWYNVQDYEYVDFSFTIKGTDSCRYLFSWEYWCDSSNIQATTDSLKFNHTTVAGYTTYRVKNKILRGGGTTNLIPGAEKVRYIITKYAYLAADSTGVGYYKTYFILR